VDGEQTAFPDTLVGTDSHTTMINGIGVLGLLNAFVAQFKN
jgi:aconitate hydratase